jgi:hypothetical protein
VTVGWCRNVISRTSVRAGEQAVDLVDESLRSEAERLLDALAEIAAHPVLFVLPPDRLEETPPELLDLAARAG